MRGSRTRSARRPQRGRGGFTLLEILAAFAIFTLMATMVLVGLDSMSIDALNSVRARELRVVSERLLGQVLVFEREYDDLVQWTDVDFDDDDERWEDFEWKLDIRDVVIFGETNDEAAEYLFGAPSDDDDETDDPADTTQQDGETQFLRELTIFVRAKTDDDVTDSVTIVTFMPIVNYRPQ